MFIQLVTLIIIKTIHDSNGVLLCFFKNQYSADWHLEEWTY